MLEISGLCTAAGDFRLRDVELSVARGQCHAVLGPSGSGKSTLLNAILGAPHISAGRILLDGEDITRMPMERRGLGYVPQQLGLFPHLTVYENIVYGARAQGLPDERYQAFAEALVETTGLGPLLTRYPSTLSGGERQRVGLVRAMVVRPALLLLDEPFTALNESLRRELWYMLQELQREQQLTMLLVTHDLTEAYYLADTVTVLLDGRVVQQGAKNDVYARPAVPEVARFLGVETLQPGTIIGGHDGLATVKVASATLTALAPEWKQTEVLVSIRGEDVVLEGDNIAAVSARNRLSARVVSIRPGSPLVCVELDVGFPLFAFVTQAACDDLSLGPGRQVTAVIKAPAVHLIPRSRC
jgi:molybdenum ABC transporter ATP-binding protein